MQFLSLIWKNCAFWYLKIRFLVLDFGLRDPWSARVSSRQLASARVSSHQLAVESCASPCFWQSYFIKLFNAGHLCCEFIPTFIYRIASPKITKINCKFVKQLLLRIGQSQHFNVDLKIPGAKHNLPFKVCVCYNLQVANQEYS